MENESTEKKWYLADVLEAFRVEGEENELLYINAILVHAIDAEEAYTKALAFGARSNYEYLNTDGVLVTVTFRGLRSLVEIYEEFADGSEIAYSQYENISSAEIDRKATPKHELAVFLPRERHDWE
jgi:hypothetical protein